MSVAVAGPLQATPDAAKAPPAITSSTTTSTGQARANTAGLRDSDSASGVAWRPGSPDAALDVALAEARTRGVPVLLFWGAAWCPPCNRLKATLFRQADFVALTRQLVPVMVDGDAPGAQQVGSRFSVRAYPTLVLLDAAGRELTRLPGEVDAAQVLRAVQRAMAGGRSVATLWSDARAGRPLSSNEWRMLGWYPWEVAGTTDLPEAQRPEVLADLAVAAAKAPTADADSVRRLQWKALVLGTPHQGLVADEALKTALTRWLGDAAERRLHADLVVFAGDDLVRRLAPEPGTERQRWQRTVGDALLALQHDRSLARGDQLAALLARVEIARLDERTAVQPQRVPAGLVAETRSMVARLEPLLTDAYERQAVLPSAAHVLARVGAWQEAQALLERNVARVPEPYALMSQLASQARTQGRSAEALRWSGQAYERSRGPATRLQWGAAYLAMRTELAPQEPAAIEALVRRLVSEAASDPGAFHERSERSLARITRTLGQWSVAADPASPPDAASARAAVLQRLQPARDALCAAQRTGSAERDRCERWWPASGLTGLSSMTGLTGTTQGSAAASPGGPTPAPAAGRTLGPGSAPSPAASPVPG